MRPSLFAVPALAVMLDMLIPRRRPVRTGLTDTNFAPRR